MLINGLANAGALFLLKQLKPKWGKRLFAKDPI